MPTSVDQWVIKGILFESIPAISSDTGCHWSRRPNSMSFHFLWEIDSKLSYTFVYILCNLWKYDFLHNFIININFFRRNYLQLDIFYKELTDKSVEQHKKYDYPTLLSMYTSTKCIVMIVEMIVSQGDLRLNLKSTYDGSVTIVSRFYLVLMTLHISGEAGGLICIQFAYLSQVWGPNLHIWIF